MIVSRHSTAGGTLLIVIAACSFGSLTTLTVFLSTAGLPLIPAMFWRYLLAELALAVILRGGLRRISRQRAIHLVLVGIFGQALITYLSLKALDFLPVGPLAFLFYTYPAWVALISGVTGKGELTLARVAALAAAMVGIVVMVGAPDAETMNPIGVALALGTAFLYALYLPVLHRIQEDTPALVSTFYLLVGALIAFGLAAAFMGNLRMPESTATWSYLGLISLVSTVTAFGALIAGLRILGPVRTSIVSTIEPFFTGILGIAFLGEPLKRSTLAGGLLIGGAILLLQWTGRNREIVTAAG
jgi:drug/metabolite transporter (DMT)-like permease